VLGPEVRRPGQHVAFPHGIAKGVRSLGLGPGHIVNHNLPLNERGHQLAIDLVEALADLVEV